MFNPKTVFPSRAKAKLSVTGTLEEPIIGLIDDTYSGIELLDCPLHYPLLNKALAYLKELISRHKLFPYDIQARRGELKALILITNQEQSEMLIRFVLRSTEAVPRIEKAIKEIQAAFPQAQVISTNIQPLPAAILEGPEEIILTSNTHIWEHYPTCSVAIEPQCFLQVTPDTASELYAHVKAWVSRLNTERMLDLFCGVGAFLLSSAPHIKKGIGIEISEAAIHCAKKAATTSGFSHLSFLSCDAEKALRNLDNFIPDTVIINPPRRGLGESLTGAITEISPAHIIYSSCNPLSLLADLKILTQHYSIQEIAPFDMFPLTEHLECVAVLSKETAS